MATQRIELQEGMSLEIAAAEGDLSILGSDERALVLGARQEQYAEFHQEGNKVVLRLLDDARLPVWRMVPLLLQQLAGDLHVRGMSGPLEVREARGDVVLADVGEVHLANSSGDVTISRAGSVRSQGYLDDDVTLRRVGAVELLEVGGDLAVQQADSLSLERVDGDVSAGGIAGEVRLNEVHGDVSLHDIGGAVEMGRVRGDLNARHLGGDVNVTRVDGDITLNMAFQVGHRYNLSSRHDIRVRFPEGTAARFVLQASRWVLPKEGSLQVEVEEKGRAVVRLGEGGPDVFLNCDGAVILGPAGDWERSVEDLGRHMESWSEQFGREMAAWGEQLRQQVEQTDWDRIGQEIGEATARIATLVESRLEEIDVEDIYRRAQRAAKKAEQRAQEVDWERIGRKIERATQRGLAQAQAGLQRLQKRLQQRGVTPPPPAPPTPPTPPAPEAATAAPTAPAAPPETAAPTTPMATPPAGLSEEKMAVLALVEEGRLTAEEASALLDALEE